MYSQTVGKAGIQIVTIIRWSHLLFNFFQVAECLGKLCLLEPTILLPRLLEFLKAPLPLVRTTGVTAIKFTISDQVQNLII